MGIELFEAVCVDVLESRRHQHPLQTANFRYTKEKQRKGSDIHTGRAAGNLSAFFHTLELPTTIRIGLALHVVIIKSPAPISDEVGSAHKRCGSHTDLIHLRDVIGHRGGVNKDMLIESAESRHGQLRIQRINWAQSSYRGSLRAILAVE